MDRDHLLEDYRQLVGSPRSACFLVEGRWPVEALLRSELCVRSVLLVEGQHADLERLASQRAPVLRQPRSVVRALVGYPFHRGVLACADRPTARPLVGAVTGGCVVVCPRLADESNLGTVVRNAAALGASAVAVPADRGADVYARKAIRTSAGAVFRMPIIQALQLYEEVQQLRSLGYTVVGSVLGQDAITINEVPSLTDWVLLLGSEAEGLEECWREMCDLKVTIPMRSGIDSLNVACSSAILLHQLVNPRGSASCCPESNCST